MFSVCPVRLDRSVLPASIFGEAPFRVTDWSVTVPASVVAELQELLQGLVGIAGYTIASGMYFRVDAYLDPLLERLWILEVSTQFVDGWGIAACLARAAGRPAVLSHNFPTTWVYDNPNYLPEVSLDAREIARATDGRCRPVPVPAEDFVPSGADIYWYGWGGEGTAVRHPLLGCELEDKMHLARLSRQWKGCEVHIPATSHVEW